MRSPWSAEVLDRPYRGIMSDDFDRRVIVCRGLVVVPGLDVGLGLEEKVV